MYYLRDADYRVATPTQYTEFYQRALDNQDRDGFQNLGSGNDVLFRAPSTQNLKINGQAGNDIIDIGSTSAARQGDHIVYGGTGDDIIQLGSGNDTVYAGFDDDTVEGGLGNDTIYGGSGSDVLFGDSLTFLTGGNDAIFGGSGNDTIVGLRGTDAMTGGSGADTFAFLNVADSSVGARDTVLDFNAFDGDMLDFHAIDADTTRAGNQDFILVDGPSTAAGTMWAVVSGHHWDVFVNVNGGAADMAVQVEVTGPVSTIEDNFIL